METLIVSALTVESKGMLKVLLQERSLRLCTFFINKGFGHLNLSVWCKQQRKHL